jgi:hypothetical protein
LRVLSKRPAAQLDKKARLGRATDGIATFDELAGAGWVACVKRCAVFGDNRNQLHDVEFPFGSPVKDGVVKRGFGPVRKRVDLRFILFFYLILLD